MLKKMTPFLIRTLLYPLIIWKMAVYLLTQTEFAGVGSENFMTSAFKDLIPFIQLPDQWYVYLTAYSLGYMYGVYSKLFGVRKNRPPFLLIPLFIGFKVTLVISTFYVAPLVLIGDILWTIIRVKKNSTKKVAAPLANNSI